MPTKHSRPRNSSPTPGLGVAAAGLCLDFVNTEGVERNSPPDRLEALDLFLDWAIGKELIDATGAAALRRAPDARKDGAAFLASARALRESLYRIFSELVAGGEPEKADVEILDGYLTRSLARLQFVSSSGRFSWRMSEPPKRLAELLQPIALSAADLLRSDRLDRLKECGGETCSWMFIDESRNRSRRWCDMSDCGNRAKAQRFYRRHSQGV